MEVSPAPSLYVVGYKHVHNTYLNAIRMARENGATMRISGRRVRCPANLRRWHCAPAPWVLEHCPSVSVDPVDLVQR